MELLVTHWHCILPLIGIAAYLFCAAKDRSKAEKKDWDWDSETQSSK
jgi:hypothetical protein